MRIILNILWIILGGLMSALRPFGAIVERENFL